MISSEHCKLRRAVHAKIDPLWKSGKIKRGRLYAMISREIGRTYHTGESDEDTCRLVLSMNLDALCQK